MTEWQMAMKVSMRTWRGTSIAEGAVEVLRQIYCEPLPQRGDRK